MTGGSVGGYAIRRFSPERGTFAKLLARDSVVRRLDWVLLSAAAVLSAVGSLLVWSATRGRTSINHGDPQYFLIRHLMNLAIGIGLCVGTIAVGHRRVRGVIPILYAVSILLLLAVLSPLGSTVNGAHSWIVIGGGFSLQPSEFAKITIILGMAMLLSARVDAGDQLTPDNRTVLQSLGMAALPMCVILLMPDLGSTMVMVVIVLGVLLSSGASNRWVLGLLAVGAAGAVAIWQLQLLSKYQIDRFAAFANPTLDPSGVGYNTAQARIAIGSGGLLGKGLFHGTQTTGQFVPEQQTDFVFTVAGEELGFLGAGLIILIMGVILWRACKTARNAPDLYGTVIAAGVVAWFAFQSFENIGMTLGIMPVAGIPLPFVSYGGSSMFAVWIGVGLLQSVRMQRPVSA
ncbi:MULTISPECIES: rod shape-determining protein RodA [Streptomycetaceae]|uniref:peptidoglycan glycosyltransferase n=1 Tax=Streptantibioticus cattleyicolor (strain ATCC 35852 / DSM 46488 / JCM 4925 / NBRC 14057 / NRRL 8057) TaxID=1003195 RepID=F8JR11_STREN|nr:MULTISPECIES: rod shape-determining protein RodA [Streptomycetaceae]AEW94094.1 cell division membrane protein [Streptantibioticus cattleyicolor NRRL 8057 = DSM 46488]MYS58762.1 rod shape-determining protein RodA [Streptomyces sp. SID5468]CCB74449.1 putative Sfr protein [Streptantibioticus cattleyicolor NRRL 8057 = DSM 46488]